MNYEQSNLIENLYKRCREFKGDRGNPEFLRIERIIYNTQNLDYKPEDMLNDWIRECHNELLKLEVSKNENNKRMTPKEHLEEELEQLLVQYVGKVTPNDMIYAFWKILSLL